ncbi:MAG: trigger factor [Myxococcaceae bacterium]
MKVRVEELSPIERKLSIEVEQTKVAEELSRAYQTLSRQVKIAGFRPGKVPRRILEQRFRDQVEDDVVHRVVERAFLEAIKEHKVEAVGNPQVTNEKLKPDQPFTFEARVEVRPKVEPKDYKGLALKKVETIVGDDKVLEQLEQMRQSMSRLEVVEGRDVVKAGDFATIDFTATCEGKDFPGSKSENITVEVTPGELIESHIAALEGAKVGETKEIDYAFPADYRVKDVAGKTAHFALQVKGLKTKVVPELNDDFAKEVGAGVQTLEELKAKTKGDLERSQKTRAGNEERDELIKALIEKNPFEVPKAMIERALDLMLEGAMRAMARGGIDPRQLGLDFGRLREEMRPRALSEVQGTLLFEAIADKESINTADEEIEKRIETLAEQSGQPVSTVRKHFKDPEEKKGLGLRLREEKTIEFLKSQATYS